MTYIHRQPAGQGLRCLQMVPGLVVCLYHSLERQTPVSRTDAVRCRSSASPKTRACAAVNTITTTALTHLLAPLSLTMFSGSVSLLPVSLRERLYTYTKQTMFSYVLNSETNFTKPRIYCSTNLYYLNIG